jgi:hypothetical protein
MIGEKKGANVGSPYTYWRMRRRQKAGTGNIREDVRRKRRGQRFDGIRGERIDARQGIGKG